MAAVIFERPLRLVVAILLSLTFLSPASSDAQDMAFKQAVAEAAIEDDAILAFYRENGFKPIWTGKSNRDAQRRKALLSAVQSAGDHGLASGIYNVDLLRTNMRTVSSQRDLGRLEVEMSRIFLAYARDVQTGLLTPRRIDEGLVRSVPLRDRNATLTAFSKSSPAAFMRKLPPQSVEYTRLMKQKMKFEMALAKGGWGAEVRGGSSIKPGATGDRVVSLRNRLINMGYLNRTAAAVYDAKLQEAVRQFQVDHGLAADGVAGPATIEAINISMETRMTQIVVAMERERWINLERGKRHIWVNLTDFSAAVVDDGKVTFRTRSVIGANDRDRRSPEFSDTMDHMVINPTWNVPRSIATKEYLPVLQENP
ncbi:MAG: peptidoglycan-binding protein, partial [Pseudomonadota bacterium]